MSVKFGVFADLHVDIIHDPQRRLEDFLEACRKEDVDFIIQLGDFCYPDSRNVVCDAENMPVNIANSLRVKTYADKDAIVALFRDFEKPSYHVLGNHDCDQCSKEELLRHHGAQYGPYYSFDMGGFHFVVLDPNYYYWNGEYVSYQNANYFNVSHEAVPVLPYLPPEQLRWLEKDLESTPYPSVLFSHQRLTSDVFAIRNAEDLRAILKKAPKGVVLALNGHEHMDNVSKVDRTWFLNVNSISNYWLGQEFDHPLRYTAQVDEMWPNLRYTVPYQDAVFSIVTLDPSGAKIQGKRSSFVGTTPEQQGVYAPGTSFHKNLWSPITAAQLDRWLPFDPMIG